MPKTKAASTSKKYYVVVKGRKPGVYASWDDCKVMVNGYSGAIYKSFKSIEEAVQYQKQHCKTTTTKTNINTNRPTTGSSGSTTTTIAGTAIVSLFQSSPRIKQEGDVVRKAAAVVATTTERTMTRVKAEPQTATTARIATVTSTTTMADNSSTIPFVMNEPLLPVFQLNSNARRRKDLFPASNHGIAQQLQHPHLAAAAAAVLPMQQEQQQQEDDDTTIRLLSIHITFDGGSRGNPGVIAGAGAVVTIRSSSNRRRSSSTTSNTNDHHPELADPSTSTVYRIRQFLGGGRNGNNTIRITNNQAEYSGILIALRVALFHVQQNYLANPEQYFHVHSIHIQGDSQLIINQLNHVYICKNQQLKLYYNQCQQYIQQLLTKAVAHTGTNHREETSLLIEHIYRNENQAADALGNEAMDQQVSFMTSSDDNHSVKYPLDMLT